MKAKTITLKGQPANLFTAALMVDAYGEKAREKCSGPALEAVEFILAQRAKKKEEPA